MSEYISRKTAYQFFNGQLEKETGAYSKGRNAGLRVAMSAVMNNAAIPAADVRPVKRGKWVKARGSWCTPGGDPVWECSECGKGQHVYGIEHGSYGADVADGQWVSCPNCGADMRGESDA